jgi:hypothetical protein
MVKYAKSDAKKWLEKLSQRERNLSQASEEYRAEQKKPIKVRRSLRKIAELFKVPHNTLHRRVHSKGQTRLEYVQSLQKLSLIQERCLVELLVEMDQRGLGFDHHDIHRYALAILSRGKRREKPKLGHNWVPRFLNRHHEELSM